MERTCVLEERVDYYRSPVPFVARVYSDGSHTIEVITKPDVPRKEILFPWFMGKDKKTPWFPKRSNFISLVKQGVKEGDYDELLDEYKK